MVAILSGTVLFSQTVGAAGPWLDVLFLLASAICLAVGVLSLGRRMTRLGQELQRDYDSPR